MKISRIIAIGLAVVFILAIARLARLENGGPSHTFIMLPGQEPATLYIPGPERPFFMQLPKPAGERPPAARLIHGFMADRKLMSVLARRLAENGYAVLAINVNGHGENSNPFGGGVGDAGSLREDVKQAVDYLRSNPFVDGSRIAVMGHSMGAGAALDYATHDPNLKGAVMISGGWQLGPQRPKNALFIYAERDPDMIQDASPALAAHVADVAPSELGKTYGEFAQGSAVEAIRVPGVDQDRSGHDPGRVPCAGGPCGGRGANRAGQDLRRICAGQRGRSDPGAGGRSRNDRLVRGGRYHD